MASVRERLTGAARRAVVDPFESAIALLILGSGVAGLANYGLIDPVEVLLPAWESVGLNIMMVMSGVLCMVGIIFGQVQSERSGLMFLIAVVLSRFLLYGDYLGYDSSFVLTGIFDALIIGAAVTRLLSSRRVLLIVAHPELVISDLADPGA
jgi:hypothetical protein